MVLVLVSLLAFPLAGLADNLIPDGDGVAPVADNSLALGDVCAGQTKAATVLLAIKRNGSAGSTNVFKDGSTVTISVSTASGAGLAATVGASPANPITLPSDWGNQANNTMSSAVSSQVTLTAPNTPGSYVGSVIYHAAGVNSSDNPVNNSDGTLVVTGTIVGCDASAPTTTIALNPAAPNGSNGWYVSDVHVTVSADDGGGSGVAETRCVLDPTNAPGSFDDIPAGCAYTGSGADVTTDGQHVVYAASKDSANNKEAPKSKSFKIDKTAPQITFGSRTPAANDNGWNKSDVTVQWSCSDNGGSGVVASTVSQTVSIEGADQTATGTCADLAGNVSATATVGNIKIDMTKPTIVAAATTSPNAANWYKTDVGVQFTCSDGLSGIPVGACPSTQTLSTEGAGVSSTPQTVTDAAGNVSDPSNVVTVNIDKTPPTITIVKLPDNTGLQDWDVVPVGSTLRLSAADSPSLIDTLVGTLGNRTTTPSTVCSVSSGCDVPLAAAGIYTLVVKATDMAGNPSEETRHIVVYDPNGGFVTGGGWIISRAGAYAPDTSLTGKATFGFVSRYQKGATVPTGNTEFQFHVAGMNFKSTSYEWLVVNQDTTNAQYKGSGTINGQPDPNGSNYRFMLWAKDGAKDGAPDTFRIKIWYEVNSAEQVVYDNGFDQAIGSGSIVIHKK